MRKDLIENIIAIGMLIGLAIGIVLFGWDLLIVLFLMTVGVIVVVCLLDLPFINWRKKK